MRIERIEWDGFDPARLAGRLRSLVPAFSDVTDEVTRIVEGVREGGDAALREIGRASCRERV